MYRVFADRAIHAAALSHGDTQAARIFFASVLLVMSLGEAAVRLWHLWRWNMSLLDDGCRPAGDPTPITLDPEFRWRSTENYRFDGTKPDAVVTRAIDSSGEV
jgi:hypothetical protein